MQQNCIKFGLPQPNVNNITFYFETNWYRFNKMNLENYNHDLAEPLLQEDVQMELEHDDSITLDFNDNENNNDTQIDKEDPTLSMDIDFETIDDNLNNNNIESTQQESYILPKDKDYIELMDNPDVFSYNIQLMKCCRFIEGFELNDTEDETQIEQKLNINNTQFPIMIQETVNNQINNGKPLHPRDLINNNNNKDIPKLSKGFQSNPDEEDEVNENIIASAMNMINIILNEEPLPERSSLKRNKKHRKRNKENIK